MTPFPSWRVHVARKRRARQGATLVALASALVALLDGRWRVWGWPHGLVRDAEHLEYKRWMPPLLHALNVFHARARNVLLRSLHGRHVRALDVLQRALNVF